MAAEADWVAALEEKVNAAVRRIKTLRSENDALSRRVKELEARAGESPTGTTDSWAQEREEVRRRVEQLTERLGELLEVASSHEGPSETD
jgi:chaperonin cofactor prefoldin